MVIKATPEQIQRLKHRAAPINYRGLSVDQSGTLNKQSFSELLEQRIVSGYGVIWGSANDYGERFVKGAFSKSIQDMGPNSNSTYKIKFRDRHGKSVSLMSELVEDEVGLFFQTKPLDDVQGADELLTQIRSGTINNFSIGFKYIWDKIEYDDEADELIMLEARLFEISAVDIPSEVNTFALRSADKVEDVPDQVEDFISNLPPKMRLQARRLFSEYALFKSEPLEQRRQHSQTEEPQKTGIDYKYLISKL